MADPDPMTCDPGSRVYDPDPRTVIPDPIYLVTTLPLSCSNFPQHSVLEGSQTFPVAASSVSLFHSLLSTHVNTMENE